MTIPKNLLEVHTHSEAGYRPLVDFGAWRVAVLNFSDELRPEHINAMQRHNDTDEVFVLLQGQCLLFVGEGDDESVSTFYAQSMAPLTAYNVKKAVWHTHTLSPDAKVLVVENRDTTYDNSPFYALTDGQRQTLAQMAAEKGF